MLPAEKRKKHLAVRATLLGARDDEQQTHRFHYNTIMEDYKMDRVKIACKMALIGIEIKKLMQSTELIADYLQDDEFDEVTLSAIEDTLNMVEKSTQDIKERATDAWLTAHAAKDKLLKEAKANEIV